MRVTEEVHLGINIPGTLLIIMLEFIVVAIEVVITKHVYLGLKTPSTIPLTIMEFIVVLIEVVTMKEVDGRGVYRYQNIYSPYHNSGRCGILSGLSFSSCSVEKMFMVTREEYIGIIPNTLPPITHVAMLDCYFALFLYVLLTKVFMLMRGVILVVTKEDVDLGLKITATILFTIVEKVWMVMGEVKICTRSDTIYPMTKVGVAY